VEAVGSNPTPPTIQSIEFCFLRPGLDLPLKEPLHYYFALRVPKVNEFFVNFKIDLSKRIPLGITVTQYLGSKK
jgi:hypothetical protein